MDQEAKASVDELHRLVGATIHAWAIIDRQLFELFRRVTRIRADHAGAIFFRLSGTKQRMDLVDDILKISPLPAASQSAWTSWKRAVEKLLKVRNHVAHNPVQHSRTLRIGPQNEDGTADVWMQDAFNVGRHPYAGKAKLGVLDGGSIQEHLSQVDALRVQISAIVATVEP